MAVVYAPLPTPYCAAGLVACAAPITRDMRRVMTARAERAEEYVTDPIGVWTGAPGGAARLTSRP
jgi:hypothetical protein